MAGSVVAPWVMVAFEGSGQVLLARRSLGVGLGDGEWGEDLDV
jgi:hypothetical protein